MAVMYVFWLGVFGSINKKYLKATRAAVQMLLFPTSYGSLDTNGCQLAMTYQANIPNILSVVQTLQQV